MDAEALVREIESAFAARPTPAREDIAHCTYDRRYGGTFDGPCAECIELNEQLGGRDWKTLSAPHLRRYGQPDGQMTVEGYCYLLPAFLIAAIREPTELDVCVDHLSYRFGPEPNDEWGRGRLADILHELSQSERNVALKYFAFERDRDEDWGGFLARSIANLNEPYAPTSPAP